MNFRSVMSCFRLWIMGTGMALFGGFLANGDVSAGVLARTSFEEATNGPTTGFTRGVGDSELQWALGAGGVDDLNDLQIVLDPGGSGDGEQYLAIRDSTTAVNGGVAALTFEAVDVSSTTLLTVSVDVLVGSGSWNSNDFFSYVVTLGGVDHAIVDLRGAELEALEGLGWQTISASLATNGAAVASGSLFQFRGTHNGDDMGIDNLVFQGEPDVTPPQPSEVPEPTACAIWSVLGLIGLLTARRRSMLSNL